MKVGYDGARAQLLQSVAIERIKLKGVFHGDSAPRSSAFLVNMHVISAATVENIGADFC